MRLALAIGTPGKNRDDSSGQLSWYLAIDAINLQ
jgi:hypothetical protein